MHKQYIWLIIFAPLLSLAQTKYYSVSAGFGVTNSFIHSSSNKMVTGTNQTYAQFADSLNGISEIRHNFSFNVWINNNLNKNWDVQAGIGYIDMGYRRAQKDLLFGQKTHPGIGSGIIEEKSNSKKDIYYDYRFYFVQIPIWFNYKLYKSKDYKTTYQLTMGATPQFLVTNNITARLKNFTVDGEKKYTLDSSGYDGRTVNMQLNFGARIERKVDKTTTIIIQPMVAYHPFSVSNTPMLVNPLSVMLHLGLVIDIGGFLGKRGDAN